MDAVLLARIQFAFTIAYHFIFVPMSIGLSIMMVAAERRYRLLIAHGSTQSVIFANTRRKVPCTSPTRHMCCIFILLVSQMCPDDAVCPDDARLGPAPAWWSWQDKCLKLRHHDA